MYQVCIVRKTTSSNLEYLPTDVSPIPAIASIQLPTTLNRNLSLKEMVEALPLPYQQILGDINYPIDEGAALAKAITEGRASMFTDGTVDEGCGAHAYTVRTDTDREDDAVSGAAPTWGDPDTISSLRPEHFAVLAGLIWTWLLMQKYDITKGSLEGAVDNLTVVNRVNDGHESNESPRTSTSTDRDVWEETMVLLSKMPISCALRHVKGHQDRMYEEGFQGPLTRDAFWNVEMDKRAEEARLNTPMPSAYMFASSSAEFVLDGQPIHTKISRKIKQALLDPPLQKYIQQKEDWSDEVFESVDWKGFEMAMKKMTIHKRINIVKYVFNWQNTGRQKQLFEDSQAQMEDRDANRVGMCPMGCGEIETLQHFLQCRTLHDAKILNQDFYGIRKWLKEKQTHPEMCAVIERGLEHWLKTGTHIEIWDLQETKDREDLISAIQAQNYIGWGNMYKGRLATEWADLQMTYYREIYEDEPPKHMSATWWASEFIRQLLYFSLATWQHRNVYLHNAQDQQRKIDERTEVVEEMAKWYERKKEFPSEDSLNFSQSFMERCTDTTAQIRLWLGKIVDIHKYNMQTTLRGYFSKAD